MWIRKRIPNTDPDPQSSWIRIRFRIHNTAYDTVTQAITNCTEQNYNASKSTVGTCCSFTLSQKVSLIQEITWWNKFMVTVAAGAQWIYVHHCQKRLSQLNIRQAGLISQFFYIVLVGTGTYIVLNTVQRRVNPTKIKDFAGREKNYILSRLFSSSKCSEGWE